MNTYEFSINGNEYFCIGYHEEVAGTPIILVHGLLMNPYFWWKDHITKMVKYGPVYCVSLAGHYPSKFREPMLEKIDDQYLADMLEDQIKHLVGERPVNIVGHSTGALSALCLAYKYPHRVKSLICISTATHGREDAGIFGFFQWLHLKLGVIGRWIFKYIVKLNSLSLGVHKFLLSDTAKNKKKMFSYDGFDDYVMSYLPAHSRLDYRAMGHYFVDLYEIDLAARLQNVTCPCLLMFSDHDPYVPVSCGDEIAKLLGAKNVQLKIMRDTGHLFMFETPEQFDDSVLPWLEEIESQ